MNSIKPKIWLVCSILTNINRKQYFRLEQIWKLLFPRRKTITGNIRISLDYQCIWYFQYRSKISIIVTSFAVSPFWKQRFIRYCIVFKVEKAMKACRRSKDTSALHRGEISYLILLSPWFWCDSLISANCLHRSRGLCVLWVKGKSTPLRWPLLWPRSSQQDDQVQYLEFGILDSFLNFHHLDNSALPQVQECDQPRLPWKVDTAWCLGDLSLQRGTSLHFCLSWNFDFVMNWSLLVSDRA